MIKKITAVLSAAALIGGMVGIATTATAAPVEPSPADSETWNDQPIVTTDSRAWAGELSMDNVREPYDLDGFTNPVPTDERFGFLDYATVPEYFFAEENNSRTFRVTNTSEAAFTVEGISATLVGRDYLGESETHYVYPADTNVMVEPEADITVQAGETAYIEFETTDPIVSVVRTNADGRVTGTGSETKFAVTILGKQYWYLESNGFGSVRNQLAQNPSPEESTDDLYPDCEFGDTSGATQPTLGLCAFYSIATLAVNNSFFGLENPTEEPTDPEIPDEPVIVPVTVSGTVKTADGEPMSGYTVTLRDSAGVETHTDISDANGFWSVSDVFPEHYSAYILVEGEWILILSPEDFDVADEDLTDKDFVLDRGAVVVPPTEDPAPDPTPEVPEEETPPVVIPEPTPEEEVPPVTPAPEPTPEVEIPNVEPPVVVTDPPADVTPPVVETPVVEPEPVGTPATVPPVLASTGADIVPSLTFALILMMMGLAFFALKRLETGTIAAVVSKRKRPTFATPTLLAWQSKGE